ncbi:swr1 complex component, partial [Tulasnella sp. 427]
MPDEGLKHEQEDSHVFIRREDFRYLFLNTIAGAIDTGKSLDNEAQDTINKLHNLLRPYLLRRLKKEVEKGTTRQVGVSCHTIKEAMLRKANQKLVLDDMVIQKGEFDWNRILVDEMEGKMSGRKLEEALVFIEDPEDVEAARLATVESTADQADFEWEVDDLAISESPSGGGANADTLGGGANGEVDDGVGSIDDYILRVMEHELRDSFQVVGVDIRLDMYMVQGEKFPVVTSVSGAPSSEQANLLKDDAIISTQTESFLGNYEVFRVQGDVPPSGPVETDSVPSPPDFSISRHVITIRADKVEEMSYVGCEQDFQWRFFDLAAQASGLAVWSGDASEKG